MANTETDCRAVLERLYLYLDGEIAGEECFAIEAHIEACLDCFQHFGYERSIKQLIHIKCREGAIPSGLADRIRAQIRAALGD